MSKQDVKRFYDELQKNEDLRKKVKKGLEDLAKECGYEVTQEELDEELKIRWGANVKLVRGDMYSEPPGF